MHSLAAEKGDNFHSLHYLETIFLNFFLTFVLTSIRNIWVPFGINDSNSFKKKKKKCHLLTKAYVARKLILSLPAKMLFVDDLLPPIALRAITRVYAFVTFVSLYLTSLYVIVFPTTEFKNIDEHQVPPLPQPPPPSILVPLYTPPPKLKKTH